jgi:uncharacterized protein (TIGR02466 family)
MKLIEDRLFFNCVYRTDLDINLSNLVLLTNNLDFIKRKNSGGYQTRNFFPIEHTEIINLFKTIDLLVNTISEKWGLEKKLKLSNYWFNKDERFSYSLSHYHPEGIISGVFYISTSFDSGRIIFERSDLQEHYFETTISNEYNFKNYSYDAVANQVLLFPSYLKHRVEQTLTEDTKDERISLSFNYA